MERQPGGYGGIPAGDRQAGEPFSVDDLEQVGRRGQLAQRALDFELPDRRCRYDDVVGRI